MRRFLALIATDPRRPLLFGLCGVLALYAGCFAVTSITAGHLILSLIHIFLVVAR